MPSITITINDDEHKILEKRASKNLFTIREQIEDIVRRSCVSSKTSQSYKAPKHDDKLIDIFSREKRGRKRK